MSANNVGYPWTLTSGPLAGRTFWSDKAYRIALGEARLRSHAQAGVRARLEHLLAAHDAASEAERLASKARTEVDRLLDETAIHFVDRSAAE